MTMRQRAVLSLSMPPGMAREYREYARSRGMSASEAFRELFVARRREESRKKLDELQEYGVRRLSHGEVSEADIDKLVFGGR